MSIFGVLTIFVYQIGYKLLVSKRFCGPDGIIEDRHRRFVSFLLISVRRKLVLNITVRILNKAYGGIRVHMNAYGCIRMHIRCKSVT